MENRKKDHIDLAFKSQIIKDEVDDRFYYEPVLSAHPEDIIPETQWGDKKLKMPVWVSSMTGGTKMAAMINRNLATVCKEFGMGMGLGSCRIILEDDRYFEDFNVRKYIGDEQALYANLGIAQIEKMVLEKKLYKINDLLEKLNADGLIVHVNPIQEWFQPEGDRLKLPPVETISSLLQKVAYPIVIKEVGQGMGLNSLKALLEMPLLAVEFAAFGGTNFAKLELMRGEEEKAALFEPLSKIGHHAGEMLDMVNEIVTKEKIKTENIIISGGLKSFLDGYYLIQKSKIPAIYGMASGFLKYALKDYESLRQFAELQRKGLELAYSYLRIKH